MQIPLYKKLILSPSVHTHNSSKWFVEVKKYIVNQMVELSYIISIHAGVFVFW